MTSAPRRSSLLGERDAHAPRRAVADIAHRIEGLARSARGDENAFPGQGAARRSLEDLLDSLVDLVGLDHPPQSFFALREIAACRPENLDAAIAERRDVGLRRGIRPHAAVHRRCDEQRPVVRERGFRQHVVSQAVREPRKRVRGQRGDNEDVPAPEMRVRIVGRSGSSKRVEGLGGDEPLCAGGEHRPHVVAGANEKADERAGLVGRNPAGHSEQDARHAPCLSSRERAA